MIHGCSGSRGPHANAAVTRRAVFARVAAISCAKSMEREKATEFRALCPNQIMQM